MFSIDRDLAPGIDKEPKSKNRWLPFAIYNIKKHSYLSLSSDQRSPLQLSTIFLLQQ